MIDDEFIDLLISGDGDLLVSTLDGSVTVAANTSAAAAILLKGKGSIRLEANVNGSLFLNRGVQVFDGHVTLKAAKDISLAATGFVSVDGGELLLIATAGDLAMNMTMVDQTVVDRSALQTNGGDIRVYVAGDIDVSLVDARTSADRVS